MGKLKTTKRLTDRNQILRNNNKEFIQDLARAKKVFISAHYSKIVHEVAKRSVLECAKSQTISYCITFNPDPEMTIY